MKNTGIDFHLHTTNSDGENTVEELIELAKEEKLKFIALTDHNKFSITEWVHSDVLDVIPGCEFSCTYEVKAWHDTTEVHVVGLFPHGVNPDEFSSVFQDISDGKRNYIEAILEDLKTRGMFVSMEEVEAAGKVSGNLGRHEIARVLMDKGYACSMDEAFDRWIGNFSPYYIPATHYIHYASLEKAVKQIQKSGGIPILAHPFGYCMEEAEIEQLIADFKEIAGSVAGMEVYYERYLPNEEKMEFLKKMQKKYELLPSAASDRHRVDQPFASAGDVKLFEDMMEKLQFEKL